jgi:hypothetical protein
MFDYPFFFEAVQGLHEGLHTVMLGFVVLRETLILGYPLGLAFVPERTSVF